MRHSLELLPIIVEVSLDAASYVPTCDYCYYLPRMREFNAPYSERERRLDDCALAGELNVTVSPSRNVTSSEIGGA